jgi:hypothetical protein
MGAMLLLWIWIEESDSIAPMGRSYGSGSLNTPLPPASSPPLGGRWQ